MADQRKISDIVVDLETDVKTLLKLYRNVDSNIKILLDRINKLSTKLETRAVGHPLAPPKPMPSVVPTQPVRPKIMPPSGPMFDSNSINQLEQLSKSTKSIPTQVSSPSQKIVGQPVEQESMDVDDGGFPLLQEELVHKGQRRNLRAPAAPGISGSKVSVSQSITYPDGRKLFMASVEIFNNKGLLVKQTRTNPKGRWHAPLEPGDYQVHVVKRVGDNASKPVELRYAISIPQSDSPIELGSPITE